MTQQQLQFDNGVASKLEAILQRCSDKVKLGSSLFDAKGELHARRIAAADQGATPNISSPATPTETPRVEKKSETPEGQRWL